MSGKGKRDAEAVARSEAQKIIRFGKVVYELFWDSGGPGAGAEYEYVFRWRDKYACRLSYADPRGPFDDLQTAIRGELETLDPQGLRGGECRGAYTLLDGGTNGPRYLWKQEFRGLIRVA